MELFRVSHVCATKGGRGAIQDIKKVPESLILGNTKKCLSSYIYDRSQSFLQANEYWVTPKDDYNTQYTPVYSTVLKGLTTDSYYEKHSLRNAI